MSDHYEDSFDDSFESGSESDGPETTNREPSSNQTHETDGVYTSNPLHSKSDTQLQLPFSSIEIHRIKELGLSPAHGTLSDPDEAHTSSLQDGASPKPKRKFKHAFKKPNIGKMTQKLKNKLKKDAPVFGVTLETAIQRSQVAADCIELPTVFRECIDYLEENGTDQEGLYRLPGVKSKIEDAKSRYDKGEVVDLTDYDVNTVASLLKQYLRELPDPLIPSRLGARLEAVTMLPHSDQYDSLEGVLEDVPLEEKLMLSWLLIHMGHVIEKSSLNKMTLPNMVIVFSPTLQISAPSLHALFRNRLELFGDIELKKYVKPVVSVEKKESRVKVEHFSHVAGLKTEEEVSAELLRLTTILDEMHSKMTNKYDQKDDYIWELQRAITILRRKKKALQKKSSSSSKKPLLPPPVTLTPANGDNEFIKTLMLMEATLAAENEELLSKQDEFKAAIRCESDLIDSYKRRLRNRHSHVVEIHDSGEESADEAEMAQQVAALKWHNKELQLRNKNIIESIHDEESVIMDLNVKLKVMPFKQQLNLDEGTTVS